MTSIEIRDIDVLDEMRAVEDLQKEVWGMDDRDIVPLTHLVASRETGGHLIGAFDDHRLVGFVYGFTGIEDGRPIHHSHMLAVKPAWREHDVGYRLKLAQRGRVLAQGIDRITWTFDPLQSLNAWFNFSKLGVLSDSYRVNFYGVETSSFLHRIGTDRLWLTWLIDSTHVRQRLQMKPTTQSIGSERPSLIRMDSDGSPRRFDPQEALSGERTYIEIPANINALLQQQPDVVFEWREATRSAFTHALRAGYLVEDFFRCGRGEQAHGVYALTRGRTIEDFA